MSFRVGVTRDLLGDDGRPLVDIGLDQIDAIAGLEWAFLAPHRSELSPQDIAGFDSVLAWDTAITAATVADPGRLVHVARLGVGLDAVDVNACTSAGVLVTITPDAVRRPVASGAVALLLALSHRVPMLDRLVRAGCWYENASGGGRGLTGRTLGVIGLGNIGGELVRLSAPWEMHVLAHDPYPPAEPPRNIELTSLETLLRESDFVMLTCPLNDETRHLINAQRLALMKPTAYLINVARGAIVDTDALVSALARGRLAGAALDVLEQEPPGSDHPLLRFENVIVCPHAIAATDEFNLGVGGSAIASVRAVAVGAMPAQLVNPAALSHPRLASRVSTMEAR